MNTPQENPFENNYDLLLFKNFNIDNPDMKTIKTIKFSIMFKGMPVVGDKEDIEEIEKDMRDNPKIMFAMRETSYMSNFNVDKWGYKKIGRAKNEDEIDGKYTYEICVKKNINCTNMKNSYGCTNCTNCENCIDCHNCIDCKFCVGCKRCNKCEVSLGASFCINSDLIQTSTFCQDCSVIIQSDHCYKCKSCSNCFHCNFSENLNGYEYYDNYENMTGRNHSESKEH